MFVLNVNGDPRDDRGVSKKLETNYILPPCARKAAVPEWGLAPRSRLYQRFHQVQARTLQLSAEVAS